MEDDPAVKAMVEMGREILRFSVHESVGFHLEKYLGEMWLMNENQALMRQADLPLEGLHNVANALAALAIGTAVNLKMEAMCNALCQFKGLSHRMQKVAKLNGVTWINDSKATNVGACIAALEGYQRKVILIAGGDAKGADMKELIPVVSEKTRCVVLVGKDADKINTAINGCVPSYRASSMKEAVQIAAKLAEDGDSVLLSPACASIDQYTNYQERGDKFTAAVLDLAA